MAKEGSKGDYENKTNLEFAIDIFFFLVKTGALFGFIYYFDIFKNIDPFGG